jgi:hypothetical protein
MESGGGQIRGGGFVAGGNGVEVGEGGERVREGGQGVARAVWAVCCSCASAMITTGYQYVLPYRCEMKFDDLPVIPQGVGNQKKKLEAGRARRGLEGVCIF